MHLKPFNNVAIEVVLYLMLNNVVFDVIKCLLILKIFVFDELLNELPLSRNIHAVYFSSYIIIF